MAAIYIISGPTQSNKTTRLAKWCAGRRDVAGLLSPILLGKRSFLNLRTNEWRPMEADILENGVQQVGRFTFSNASFSWANKQLLTAFNQPDIKWLIIDEIGPLELQDKGLAPSLNEILKEVPQHLNLILIIREKIMESVVYLYELDRYPVKPFDFPE